MIKKSQNTARGGGDEKMGEGEEEVLPQHIQKGEVEEDEDEDEMVQQTQKGKEVDAEAEKITQQSKEVEDEELPQYINEGKVEEDLPQHVHKVEVEGKEGKQAQQIIRAKKKDQSEHER